MTDCTNKKPFDIEKALAGAPFGRKSGKVPTQWFYFDKSDETYPVFCVFDGVIIIFTSGGREFKDYECDDDLVMLPIKKTWWFASWKDMSDDGILNITLCAYDSKERLLASTDGRDNAQRVIHSFEIEE